MPSDCETVETGFTEETAEIEQGALHNPLFY